MNTAQYGMEKERERIRHYETQGWWLLQRAVRTRFQREDVGGAWDLWFGDEGRWLFVQVAPWKHRARKLRLLRRWLSLYTARDWADVGIRFVLDLYKPPHYEGRGAKRKWVGMTTWETVEL